MEKRLPSPLVLPAIFWGFGILSREIIRFKTALIFFILLLPFLYFKKFKTLTILFLIFTLGNLRVNMPKSEISAYQILQKKEIISQKMELEIISFPIIKNHTLKYEAKIKKIGVFKSEGKIYLITKNEFLKSGDYIRGIFVLKNLNKVYRRPSQIKYLRNNDIDGIAENITPIKIIRHKNNLFKNTVENIKVHLKIRIKERFGKNSEFVKAIIIGDKGRIRFWKKILKDSGMSHLLAVSGLHVGMISFIFYTIFKIIFPNRNYARFASIILLIFYAAVCNWSASVTRASLMLILFYFAKIIERPLDKNQIIGVAFLIITIINPKQIFSVGFQMSFTAVIVLINFIPFQFSSSKNPLIKSLKNIGGLVQTSAILTIFLSPITIYNFGQINLNGVIANIFGIPFFGILLSTSLIVLLLPNITFMLKFYESAFSFLMIIFSKVVSKLSKLPFKYVIIDYQKPKFLFILFLLFAIALTLKIVKKKPV